MQHQSHSGWLQGKMVETVNPRHLVLFINSSISTTNNYNPISSLLRKKNINMPFVPYEIKQELQEMKNKAPMPWVGIYVAVASLFCSVAMAVDAFLGFRHNKLWFPYKFFTLNAASLTILAIAMKLPMDLSTNMPGKTDQLAKLSSTTLMCTAIGNFMPSLGTMDDKQILMNVTALGILVITILANVCIQIGTGLLSNFLMIEHTAVMFSMLVLLVILSFSALTVPTTKKHLQQKYGDLHKITSTEELEEIGMVTVQKLKDYVKKYWMMAETGCPQFVMARSVTCSASAAICSLTTVIVAEAELRTYLFTYNPYNLNSDYKWSILFILVIQTIRVGIGTIALYLDGSLPQYPSAQQKEARVRN